MSKRYDLIVIGAGPGGYVAAIRAAQLGLSVACVEAEKKLGGTCLRVGCIPSKALLESSHKYVEAKESFSSHGIKLGGVELDLKTMMKRKSRVVNTLTTGIAHLFKKNGVDRFEGLGSLVDPNTVSVSGSEETVEIQGERILIATGSSVTPLKGVETDGDLIGGSTAALSYPEVPESLVVIGGGVIGLELGSVWSRLGSKVIVLEYQDRLMAGMDDELAKETQKILAKQGIEFRLGVRVTGAVVKDGRCEVTYDGGDPITCDRVLLSVGRKPNTDGLNLAAVGVKCDDRGRVDVDAHYQTNVPSIFAIGDVIKGPMLAHKAEEEGVACVEHIVTGYGHINYDAIPSVVYTHPEVASVGKTEAELNAAGIEYRSGKFPFMANGRARAMNDTEGFVKILAHAKTDRLLGAHIVGPHAGDLIAEAAVAIEFGASAEDLARSCHAHPTLAEVVKEAALAVDKRALHI
jgi:dihydrolipoamide dehydrogenase